MPLPGAFPAYPDASFSQFDSGPAWGYGQSNRAHGVWPPFGPRIGPRGVRAVTTIASLYARCAEARPTLLLFRAALLFIGTSLPALRARDAGSALPSWTLLAGLRETLPT